MGNDSGTFILLEKNECSKNRFLQKDSFGKNKPGSSEYQEIKSFPYIILHRSFLKFP